MTFSDWGMGEEPEKVPMIAIRGICPQHKKPGGCQYHNLECGYPACDTKFVAAPIPVGEVTEVEITDWVKARDDLMGTISWISYAYAWVEAMSGWIIHSNSGSKIFKSEPFHYEDRYKNRDWVHVDFSECQSRSLYYPLGYKLTYIPVPPLDRALPVQKPVPPPGFLPNGKYGPKSS